MWKSGIDHEEVMNKSKTSHDKSRTSHDQIVDKSLTSNKQVR